MNSFSSIIHKKLFFFIIVLFGAISLSSHQYYGSVVLVKGMSSTISNEDQEADHMELEKQLNKTPIKSILTENGIIIDCVDIYKQPAFDHPLLKNHRIQMRPKFNPQVHNTSSTDNNNGRREVVLQRMGCPKGSVPIRRTSKEDLIRAQAFTESYSVSINDIGTPSSNGARSNVAYVGTKSNTGQKFYGLQAYLNPQNPEVGADQSSSSQFWIQNGASATFNSLQAGWIVSPSLYNDSKTHLFGFWRVDGPSKASRGGCFDNLCHGFVQTDTQFPIGSFVTPTSYYGEPDPSELKVGIYQDRSTGNWWLTILKDDINIGYWPKELLPGLSDGSTDIAFGGQTKGNLARQSPMMGNGHFPAGKDKFSYGCYMSTLKVFNASSTWEDPLDSILEEHTDNERCYDVDYYGYVSIDYQRALQLGGPGGVC